MATYFVVGASRGIGLEFVKQLISSGNYAGSRVIAGARKAFEVPALLDLQKNNAERLTLLQIDVGSDESVKEAAKKATEKHPEGIDYLIINAGVLGTSELSATEFHATFDTNVVGPMRVVQSFLPLVKRASKKVVVTISSSSGSAGLQDRHRDFFHSLGQDFHGYSYRVSKSALNLLTIAYAKDYAAEGITFVPVHPGMVETDFFYDAGCVKEGNKNVISATECVDRLLKLFNTFTIEHSGKFLNNKGEIMPN